MDDGRVGAALSCALLAVALLAPLAGCSSPEPATVAYLRPTGLPAQASNARVREPSAVVFTRLQDQLQRSSLKIEQADRRRGLIVVTYTGSPEQFVDCGWIVQQCPQGLSKVPGASDQAVFQGVAPADGANMRRNLKLDARSVVQIRPVGIYTDVLVDSTNRRMHVATCTKVEPATAADVTRREFEALRSGTFGNSFADMQAMKAYQQAFTLKALEARYELQRPGETQKE